MAFFRKKQSDQPADGDVATLMLQGHDMLERTAALHHERWGLGTAERYDVDLAAGTISWTFPDRTAVAPVQILGSHHAGAGEWAWAWAIDAVPAALRVDAERARAFGEAHDTPFLTAARLPVDEEGAADVAAVAFRIAEATGFYRGPGASSTYFTFGDVTLTAADGTTEVFRLRAEE